MFSNFLFQRILNGVSTILELLVYKSEPVLPYYTSDIECDYNTTIGKRCLDGDMDSVFFV
jgi:hypothetical protein